MNKTEFLAVLREVRTKIEGSLAEENQIIERDIAALISTDVQLSTKTKRELLELFEESRFIDELRWMLFRIPGAMSVKFDEDAIRIEVMREGKKATATWTYEKALVGVKVNPPTQDNAPNPLLG